MTWETFKRAVDSLEGYRGGVSMMGGEPTLHPEFERFARYLESQYDYLEKKKNYFIYPTKNFVRDRRLEEREYSYTYEEKTGKNVVGTRVEGPVMFSSLASNYYKYYETIQDVFRYQGVNDHIIPCYHQPVGVMRKDLGIDDKSWLELRNNCWVQNSWSASITPKGAFFCEIAGVLDMLFDGPGGWPIEKGWWQRKPKEFEEQLHWCELCGLALKTSSRNANDEIDDVSESFYCKLKEIDSPKLKKGQVNIYKRDIKGKSKILESQYHKTNMDRVSKQNNNIYPDGFIGVVIADGYGVSDIKDCIETNLEGFKRIILVIDEKKESIKQELKYDNVEVALLEKRLGVNLSRINQKYSMEYIICMTPDVHINMSFMKEMLNYVYNPGVMHYTDRKRYDEKDKKVLELKKGQMCLYNTGALAIKRNGFDGVARCTSIDEYIQLWETSKIIPFGIETFEDRKLVNGIDIIPNKRYVIYGTGIYGRKAFELVKEANAKIVFACDSNTQKWNTKVWGDVEILSPKELSSRRSDYDYAIIAAIAYKDIREKMIQEGLSDSDIIAPIF